MKQDRKTKTVNQEKTADKKQPSAASSGKKVVVKKKSIRKTRGVKVVKKKTGARYAKARKLVDSQELYTAKEAVSLLRKTASANFGETAEAHLTIKQESFSVQVDFPYDQGKKRVIAIADDESVMAKIKSGQIDFDVLLASPKMMPKLVSYARILGPKGLMPNPKEGTVTADPEKKAKELAKAGVKIKTEKKAPLIHTVFGRASQKQSELEANLEALIKAVDRQNIKKLVIASTMGPGIVVNLD